ncbi:MAG: glycosyltransferase [Gammaproteobacteria bacterium]
MQTWRVKYLLQVVQRYGRYASVALDTWRSQGATALLARIRRKLRRAAPTKPRKIPPLEAWRPLQFPSFQTPVVSIVIPVYNQHLFTFRCLQSVQTETHALAYETIVVDDASQDETAAMLAAMQGVSVVRNEANLGFIGACNRGAQAARGEFLLFLNNDTVVQTGWLDALVETFSRRPDAGLVGARLIYPDGRLQEAGGIVWRDGSAWNYGRGDDPDRPQYGYLREADYCSGACLVIRRTLFLTLGMFDPYYAPAYYEDTDLAFKVRAAGKRVYYQPRAVVIHDEGVTSGTDTGSGVKRHQIANARKFFERWQAALASHRPNGLEPELEKERSVQRRAFIVDQRMLMPDHDSGSLRMAHLLAVLQRLGFKTTFAAHDLQRLEPYTGALQTRGVEVLYAPYVPSITRYLKQHGQYLDIVILSRADIAAQYADSVRSLCPRAKLIFDTVDLHFLREQRQAEWQGTAALARRAAARKRQELARARQADLTLVVSPSEKALLEQEDATLNVALISNIHTIHGATTPFEARRDLLFIGNFEHPPNVDAMRYFIAEIWPMVAADLAEARLVVVGGDAPSSLTALASERIMFTGAVPDIAPLFERVRVSIAPLRYGAGVKGKINTSMSYGVPVVATPMAAEGMALTDGVDVLIGADAAAFAAAVVRLYRDGELWRRLSASGLVNIEQYFSFAAAERQLRAALLGLGIAV